MVTVQRMSIHQKILELREKAGMSQDDLEKATGLSQAAISNIENEKTKPRKNTLVKIAKALGITLEELLADTTTSVKKNGAMLPSGRATEPNFYCTQDEITMLTNLRLLNDPAIARRITGACVFMPQVLLETLAPFDGFAGNHSLAEKRDADLKKVLKR